MTIFEQLNPTIQAQATTIVHESIVMGEDEERFA